MMHRSLLLAAMTLVVSGPSLAQSKQPAPTATPVAATDAAHLPPRYRLRAGDAFSIDFVLVPELNQTVTVQPDGYVSLKSAAAIPALGLNLNEVSDAVRKAYASILRDPLFTITLTDFEKPFVIVGGQVAKPGKYDLRTPLTVSQAVAIAGGFTEDSKHSQVVLFHPISSGGYMAQIVDVKHLMAKRDMSDDPVMQNGDTLFIPKNSLSKIRRYLPTTSIGAYLNNLSY